MPRNRRGAGPAAAGRGAFPTAEGLYHYLLATEAELVGFLVELDAEPSGEVDFDADQGAVLVIPTAIQNVRPMQPEAIDTIRSLSEQ